MMLKRLDPQSTVRVNVLRYLKPSIRMNHLKFHVLFSSNANAYHRLNHVPSGFTREKSTFVSVSELQIPETDRFQQ